MRLSILRFLTGTMPQYAFVSMDDYRSLPETTRAELINNVLHEPPAPLYGHQNTLMEIAYQLRSYTQGDPSKGTLVIAPFDVYLDELSNAVQPDIILILPGNKGHLGGHFHGVPDFIVEIISPGNRHHDLKTKLELYERFGVQEYWIVDPQTDEAQGFKLFRRKFRSLGKQKGSIQSPLLRTHLVF